MSFWDASDKIPVRQTKVAVQAEHGLNYVGGQKITIIIPPTVQYFQPKESFLRFDLRLDQGGDAPTRVQLDSGAGAQMLIKDLRVLSGGAGAQLLEEYQDYNILATLRYDYDNDETLSKRRALTEGTTGWDQTARGTRGTTKSTQSSIAHSEYSTAYVQGTNPGNGEAGVWGDALSTPVGNGLHDAGNSVVKICLPLHTGIFQNARVFPALLTEGLRLEILLEDANKVVKVLDTTNRFNRATLAPIFHSCTGLDADLAAGLLGDWGVGAGQTTVMTDFFVKRDNNMIELENFPFVVGEKIYFLRNDMDPINFATGVGVADQPGVTFTSAGGPPQEMVISEIELAPAAAGRAFPLIHVTLAAACTITGGYGAGPGTVNGATGSWSITSTSVLAQANDPTPAYTMSNVELVLQQLEMPGGYTRKMMSMMKQGGTINYDFLSSTNYKYSQLAGDVVANIRLPLSQSRARSILSVPCDSTVYSNKSYMLGGDSQDASQGTASTYAAYVAASYTYQNTPAIIIGGTGTVLTTIFPAGLNPGSAAVSTGYVYTADKQMYSTRSGMVGIWDNMTNYQWFYNGQLNPNRAVDVSKISSKMSISQQGLVELEKALAMAGIPPKSMAKYRDSAVIGRALSLQDGVYDCRGRDFNLQVNYNGTAPVKNKLWSNFVHHIRRLQIRGDAISIQI